RADLTPELESDAWLTWRVGQQRRVQQRRGGQRQRLGAAVWAPRQDGSEHIAAGGERIFGIDTSGVRGQELRDLSSEVRPDLGTLPRIERGNGTPHHGREVEGDPVGCFLWV